MYHFIPAITPLGQALATILSRLSAILANGARTVPTLLLPLLTLASNRLVRMVRRLDRLAAQWQAGTLPKPRPARTPRPATDTPRPERPFVPNTPAWLIRLVQPIARLRGQVAVFLADPQTQALIHAAPQAGRILRPLCRMLGLELPAVLRLPARPPAPPRIKRAHPPRPRLHTFRSLLATPPPRPTQAGPSFLASHIFRT